MRATRWDTTRPGCSAGGSTGGKAIRSVGSRSPRERGYQLQRRGQRDTRAPNMRVDADTKGVCSRRRPGTESSLTLSWRGVDSNFQYAEAVKLVVAPFSCADCFGRVSEPVDVPARACRPMRARSTSPPDGSPPAARTASTSWRSRKRRATPNLPDVITRARRRRL